MKEFLEKIYSFYNKKSFIGTDPIVFPHNFSGNKEYISFIAAMFAYGRVSLIQRFLDNFFSVYGTDPCKIKPFKKNIYYRFQSEDDIFLFVSFLHKVYSDYGSLFEFFKKIDVESVENAYKRFRADFFEFCSGNVTNGIKSLLPDISKSAAKRVWMFFRWMVREDEIDFGFWKGYETSVLKYPLDTHILTFAYNRKIIEKKNNSYSNAVKITNFMKKINETDPVKYDFALSRLGIIDGCIYKKYELCDGCQWKKVCVFN